jgi:hypothetical protein
MTKTNGSNTWPEGQHYLAACVDNRVRHLVE